MFHQVQYTQTFYSQGESMLESQANHSAKIFPLQNFPRTVSKQISAWTHECEANLGFHTVKLIELQFRYTQIHFTPVSEML